MQSLFGVPRKRVVEIADAHKLRNYAAARDSGGNEGAPRAEAAQAMRDYEANRVAIRAKTERLRAVRLAKEASIPTTKKSR